MRALLLLSLLVLSVGPGCTETTEAADVPSFVVPEFPQFDFDFGPVTPPDSSGPGDTGPSQERRCCDTVEQCAPDEECRPANIGVEDQAANRCVSPVPGACWADEDCPAYYQCKGAILCSCTSCPAEERPGECKLNVPEGCCTQGSECTADDNTTNTICLTAEGTALPETRVPPVPDDGSDAGSDGVDAGSADVAGGAAIEDAGEFPDSGPLDTGEPPDADGPSDANAGGDTVDPVDPPVTGVGRCSAPLEAGACWRDDDCTAPDQCVGAVLCACDDAECTVSPGVCRIPLRGECNSDVDCDDGKTCISGGTCGADCDPKDPLCCDNNQCVVVTSVCTTNDQCSSNTCLPAAPCSSWCNPPDPTCCYGNKCLENKCVGNNPQGCYFAGCGPGMGCRITTQCKSSSCTCNVATGWQCADDCIGGICVPSKCPGLPPSGCLFAGCPAGMACSATPSTCVPTACECDEASGSWSCTSDCDGGICVPE